MSRFHFDEGMANEVKKSLLELEGFMNDSSDVIGGLIDILKENDSFGVINAIEDICSEIKYEKHIGFMAKSGAETLSQIINSLDNNAKAATNLVNTVLITGTETIQSVIETSKNSSSNITSGNIQQAENPFDRYPTGSYMNDEGKILIPNNSNSIKIIDSETGGKNYVMLAPTEMGLFEHGGYRGYKQTTRDGLGGWFHSDYQCVATAMATTSMYNGIYETPYDRYSSYDYENGENGYAIGCYWSGYGEIGPQEFTDYCVNRLLDGKATTIYAHADYSHDTGHAATVVGYINRGSTNPMYDLIVVDPWTGDSYFLFESYNMTYGKNGYFTYDTAN
ncbi:MAG: hypothetical protein NC452_08255 [Eubacterium sp.]|nr:hypothetical protein [Eubacterium sp.]